MIALFAIGCEEAAEYEPMSSGCQSTALVESGLMDLQSGGTARTYYLKLPNGYDSSDPLPLVFGIHGTGGSGEAFVDDTYYDLESTVGDDAILVYPNALAAKESIANWNQEVDSINWLAPNKSTDYYR